MRDLIAFLMLIAEEVSQNSQVLGGCLSLKIHAMERDLYKQTKLSKTLEFILKTISNFKATANF